MTIIAWDGTTLAADKQADIGGYKATTTKIFKIRNHLVFGSGNLDVMRGLIYWFEQGADITQWPATQNDKEMWSSLHVIGPDKKIWRYERTPHPFLLEEQFYACGSGRDFALAAMYLGKNASSAVEVASRFCLNCGMGTDVLTHDV